ncbi:MAG: hypothetical protein M1833_000732 [Piccolia ochrophora]|nr:MAG: hypothetical protein M1833_000732 [Piccolia ochrophora]
MASQPPSAPALMRRPPACGDLLPIHGPPSSNGRRSNLFYRPSPQLAVRPLLRDDDGWENWHEVAIKLRGLQPNITTLELWRTFSKEGEVNRIEIFEGRSGRRDGAARIWFRPPPVKPFWQAGVYWIRFSEYEDAIKLDINLEENRKQTWVTSPVNATIRYPQKMALHAESLDFGCWYNQTSMIAMQTTHATSVTPLSFQLDLQRKRIEIDFVFDLAYAHAHNKNILPGTDQYSQGYKSINEMSRTERYRFHVPLDQLQEIRIADCDGDKRSFVVSLGSPPNFYRKAVGQQLESSHTDGNYWNDWDTWFRQTDIVYDPRELRTAPIGLRKRNPLVDIGEWTTYRFVLPSCEHNSERYLKICNALKDHYIKVEGMSLLEMLPRRDPAIWDWIDKSDRSLPLADDLLTDLEGDFVPGLTFPVQYQLEVCISQGYLNVHNLSRKFIERLVAMGEQSALDALLFVAQEQTRIFDPMNLYKKRIAKGSMSRIKIPHYCVHVKKATVTPSTIYFSTPAIETSNRVIRNYMEHSDRFLRVQFTDEKFQGGIYSTDKNINDEVFTRISRALTNGITIGDRHFEFLAFGNSQFREHGAYFFAPTKHLTVEDIRCWMGDFTAIRVPALYAARIGQCFSTTRAINGTRVHIVEIQDVIKRVKAKDGKSVKTNVFNFTDGVGKISEALAKLIAGELKLRFVPSAFQFRLGGCKGILVVSPDAHMWQVHIRKSQYKFPAVHNGLEIIRWSLHTAASLNRQIVMVLTALGVKSHVFVDKLKSMLFDMHQAMWNESKALYLLQRHIDPNQATITVAGMILDGFMKTQDPFVISLLRLWRSWSIKYLKEKARIIIDQGTFLLGCTDETQTLKGQFMKLKPCKTLKEEVDALPEIFVQVPNPEDPEKYMVIEGICILARNPSLHPGDIRVVRAVDNPRLYHLRDVVVLPQTGDRDIASMCSGGDLDGDDFLVIWDKDLIPTKWDEPAMDYSAPPSLKLDRDITNHDLTSFFVNYIKNDRLPRIAHAHLAFADLREGGVRDETCLRLAALHSKAVDYVKTGEPAVLPRDARPRSWPHFMEKEHSPKYISDKVLGQLYDQVERVDFVPCYEAVFDERILRAFDLEEGTLTTAREIKGQYDADMHRIMAQHQIGTEFEVWSTFVLHHAKSSKDYKFHEEMGQISMALKERYRRACISAAGGKEHDAIGPFAAAMYAVTQQEMAAAVAETKEKKLVAGKEVPKRKLNAKSMPLMSFPWCLSDVLGKIANGKPAGMNEGLLLERLANHRVVEETPFAENTNVEADVIETEEGLTHRGEVLELFHHSMPGPSTAPSEAPSSGDSSRPPTREHNVFCSGDFGVKLQHTLALGEDPAILANDAAHYGTLQHTTRKGKESPRAQMNGHLPVLSSLRISDKPQGTSILAPNGICLPPKSTYDGLAGDAEVDLMSFSDSDEDVPMVQSRDKPGIMQHTHSAREKVEQENIDEESFPEEGSDNGTAETAFDALQKMCAWKP